MTEIFIEPELAELETAEQSTAWLAIAAELGLDRQLAFTEKSPQKKAPPYMVIDDKTRRIIKTLCPECQEYNKYEQSTIPLDVLQEICKCVKNGWYKNIFIYYDNKSPDPFVVGVFEGTDRWDRHYHLIARWGAELLPFELLEEKALARIEIMAAKAVQDMKADMDIAAKNIKTFCRQQLEGMDKPYFNFSVGSI